MDQDGAPGLVYLRQVDAHCLANFADLPQNSGTYPLRRSIKMAPPPTLGDLVATVFGP